MNKIIITILAALALLVPTSANAQGVVATDVGFTQCVYSNSDHSEYVTTRTLVLHNQTDSISHSKVTVTTEGKSKARKLLVVLSPNARVDLHIQIKPGQVKFAQVETDGAVEAYRLGNKSSACSR